MEKRADGRLWQVTAGLDGALFLLLKRLLKVMYLQKLVDTFKITKFPRSPLPPLSCLLQALR